MFQVDNSESSSLSVFQSDLKGVLRVSFEVSGTSSQFGDVLNGCTAASQGCLCIRARCSNLDRKLTFLSDF